MNRKEQKRYIKTRSEIIINGIIADLDRGAYPDNWGERELDLILAARFRVDMSRRAGAIIEGTVIERIFGE